MSQTRERGAQSSEFSKNYKHTNKTHYLDVTDLKINIRGCKMETTLDMIRSRRVAKDRRRLVRLSAIVLVGIFVLVGMRAYCAYMQHVNNQLVRENGYIQAEIDSLNSQLVEEIKVTRIERVAMDKYGMVFPTAQNCINLSTAPKPEENLAAIIRSEAYN